MSRWIRLIVLGCLLTACGNGQAADWPMFRGPAGDGRADDADYPLKWGPEHNVQWRMELPTPGNSSPIISSGRVFVTTATDGGTRRHLYCLDRNTGKQLWVRSVDAPAGEATHQTNPYCGSTPLADGKLVIVWHGNAGLHCYDFSGNPVWSSNVPKCEHIWGYGSSPVLHEGRVFLNAGPGIDSKMIAFEAATGRVVWSTPEPGGANDRNGRMVGSWSTPVVTEVDGELQLICSMPTRVVAYRPGTGDIAWSVTGLSSPRGDLCYTSPLFAGQIGIALGGYKGPGMGFTLGGSGDVTEANRLWETPDGQPQRIGSGVVVGNHFYQANAGPGIIQCLEVRTGQPTWQQRVSGTHWASIVLASGRLYATNQDGVTRVFEPDPEKFVLLAENDLQEPTNATPAFSDGQIVLRTDRAVYGLSLKP